MLFMHSPIAERLKGLTELIQQDFHSACQQAVQLLYPWPLAYCQISYFDQDHSQHILGTAGAQHKTDTHLKKLGEFAAGTGKLSGTLAPLAEHNPDAQQLIDAVCRQLTSSWARFQLGRRLIAAKQAKYTSEKLREWQANLSTITQQVEDIRTVYQYVHASLHSLMHAQNVMVAIADRKQGLFRFVYTRDTSLGDAYIEGESFPLEDLSTTLTGYVFGRGSAVLLNQRAIRRLAKLRRTKLRGDSPTSWLGVPFSIDQDNDGIVILQTYGKEPIYQESDKNMLVTASRYISLAHQRHQAEKKLQYQANHDSLTGLINRKSFMKKLEQQLESRQNACVMFIDLDDFKQLNDRHGHRLGDYFLCRQAKRLSALLQPGELASRLGGDEFAVLLQGGDQARAQQLAEHICTKLSTPFAWQHLTLNGHVSIGIAQCDTASRHNSQQAAERLLNQADHAMYRAKRTQHSSWHWFDARLQAELARRSHLERSLEQAISDQQLMLHYQPIYNSADMSLRGFECLLRWDHPELGRVSPAEFIPLAEETGQIQELDHWVMEQAASRLEQWHRDGYCVRLTVNVSSRHFCDSLFPQRVKGLFERYQLPKQSLLFELTEHALLSHVDAARDVINQLSEIGVRLALDDFGTGFSSLSYLNSLPFDVMKIDRSFVAGLPNQQNASRIVSTIISLAQSMGMVTIAEGVETLEQQYCLRDLGCDRLQGFLLGKPMILDDAEQLLVAETALQDSTTVSLEPAARTA